MEVNSSTAMICCLSVLLTVGNLYASPDSHDSAIAKAMEALAKAASRVWADRTRPLYHFLPPAQWMNDPCGGLKYKGWYHVFYQVNPYGDRWDKIHWGHARSKDMVYWEHLPVALAPLPHEVRCNSGCVTINKQGEPMIFYTSVLSGAPREQCAAIGDDDLIRWKRNPENPILTLQNHGGPQYGGGWSDCYIFEHQQRTFMVIGVDHLGDQVAVPLYEAQNPAYTQWAYRGLLFQAPRSETRNMEVPIFFELGDKWILLYHPSGPIEYCVGTFDIKTLKFVPQKRGKLVYHKSGRVEGVTDDRGLNSPHVFFDDSGRCIMYGWISGFKNSRGWNGCLALPRVLSLDTDDRPVQRPVPELIKLRAEHFRFENLTLEDSGHVLQEVSGDTLEILVTFKPKGAKHFGLRVRRSDDGRNAVVIGSDGRTLDVAGTKAPLQPKEETKTLTLHVFLDRSVLEVFASDGRTSVAKVIYPDEQDLSIELFALHGKAIVESIDIWQMKSIW
ncbi:MAG: glycoside hydrolase family 32 protein [Planctomycetota bacterium]|jgi:beta-fructofuranosidase